jgi:hypothetical protein
MMHERASEKRPRMKMKKGSNERRQVVHVVIYASIFFLHERGEKKGYITQAQLLLPCSFFWERQSHASVLGVDAGVEDALHNLPDLALRLRRVDAVVDVL